jgi:hypothetical protein
MNKYTWILTPSLQDIDIENMYSYSCYDDRCLISTFFIDDILDLLDRLNLKCISHVLNEKYQYKILLEMSDDKYNSVKNNLVNFSTGRFITTSIYVMIDDKWVSNYKLKR